jgi:hypothetical protein
MVLGLFRVSCLGLLASPLVMPSCCAAQGEDGVSTSAGLSLGDRLVLEIHYKKTYQSLPLTEEAAVAQGWSIQQGCLEGMGRLATSTSFKNASGSLVWSGDSALHLWFDQAGAVIGFGAGAVGNNAVAEPWHQLGDVATIDFLLRDPASACGTSSAVANSVGDRLVMVKPGFSHETIPFWLQGAFDAGYNNGGPCFPDMGWHMIYDRFEVSSPVPVYDGPGNYGGRLLAMNLNTYLQQATPSYEAAAPKEGHSVFGWHVYFREHEGACTNSAEAPALPVHDTMHSRMDYKCTPYFGNMFVMAPLSVVDLHASGDSCKDADGRSSCAFVNFLGPTAEEGSGTPCATPSPTDGCHCYVQTMYTQDCADQVSASTLSGKVDKDGAFDSDGTLKACIGKVAYWSVVGWAPSTESSDGLTSCKCDQSGKPSEAGSAVHV